MDIQSVTSFTSGPVFIKHLRAGNHSKLAKNNQSDAWSWSYFQEKKHFINSPNLVNDSYLCQYLGAAGDGVQAEIFPERRDVLGTLDDTELIKRLFGLKQNH